MRAAGLPLFLQQCRALLGKNALLSWRNRASTALQLGSSLFFIFLIWAVGKAIDANNATDTSYKNLFTPGPEAVTPIPACEEGYFIRKPCYDFLWSGNGSALLASLVRNISLNNHGRPIDLQTKVLGFATPSDVDDWLAAHTLRAPAALHLRELANGGIGFGLQSNSTVVAYRGNFQDPNFKFQLPLQAAAEREITHWSIVWAPSFREFAHPAIDTFSEVATIGPTFLFAAAMFGFVIQISAIVREKELHLRQAMATMGLLQSAYWLTWLLWEAVLAAAWALLLVLFGLAFQFDFFRHNDFGVLYVFFFLFALNMIGFAFMLSTFLQASSSATTLGFSIFIVGFITELITQFGFPYDKQFADVLWWVWSVFPPNLLTIGLKYLGDTTATPQDPGTNWSNVDQCPPRDDQCVITLAVIYKWLAVTFVVWFVLALYFDNVFPNDSGVHRPWLFFVSPNYWLGRSGATTEGKACSCCGRRGQVARPGVEVDATDVDADVAVEKETIKEQARCGAPLDPSVAVQLCGLAKTFAGSRKRTGCCRYRALPPFQAVKGAWFNVERGKLFCLLGPNGAGKSTTIHCLTGIIPSTGGDALVCGDSIKSPAGMTRIRSKMGVCPQFDILWDSLSGREHLRLFALIKGLPSSQLHFETEDLLSRVRLTEAANVPAGSYSGGMKRRLSVAVALIGDPEIVFLDEPTTGMDPVTRRHVWDILESAKKGRAVVLTTHSMEEADVLGDRIAIMARGRVRCLGTSIHLKTKFGAGYILNLSVRALGPRKVGSDTDLAGQAAAEAQRAVVVKDFVKEQLGIEPTSNSGPYIRFLIPRQLEPRLTGFFATLQERKATLGVTDCQLSLTTLEEVFLKIAQEAELENTSSESRFEDFQMNDFTTLHVPLGCRLVAVPNSISPENPAGLMVEVFWTQDTEGNLKIAYISSPMPYRADGMASPLPVAAPVG
eukprot:SM000045S16201  [mRNA]  locus=s45:178603:184208:+ [translate_table: standard]